MINLKLKLIGTSAVLAALALSSGIIVSSQSNQNPVEISSPTGLIPKPGNLKTGPGNDRQKFGRLPQIIPDDVAYRQMFRHIDELNKKADKLEQQNRKDARKLRDFYKKLSGIDERQARALDRIAGQTTGALRKLDDRAQKIIESLRSQNPDRRIGRGQKVPLPPQELFDLALQRKEMTLTAINELRRDLGEAGFVRFSQFVDEKVKSGITKKGTGAAIQKGGPLR